MSIQSMYTEKLFSYGTLQQEGVQLATFGRKLQGNQDFLIGYCISVLKISDPDVIAKSGSADHPVLVYSGSPADKIGGMVFDITIDELVPCIISPYFKSYDQLHLSKRLFCRL